MGSEKHVLTYFDVAGKAEASRIVFSMAGLDFDDRRIGHDEFGVLKESFPNKQVPVLEIGDRVYCQSNSIFRYACKLAGLYPDSLLDALSMDMLGDQIEECFVLLIGTMKSENKVYDRELLIDEGGKFYDRVEAINRWIKGPWYCGDTMTGADISLYCFVNFVESGFLDGIPKNYFDQFENIRNLHDKVDSSSAIINYYAKV